MTYGVYQVVGNRQYRGHNPGTVFEAVIDIGPETRAINRGDIRLIRRVTPSLVPGSYRLPDGWIKEPAQQTTTAAREG